MVEAKQDFVGEGTEIPATNRSKYTIDERVLEHELRRRLWEGAIPLKIDLSVNDLFAAEPPRSLYIMAPRENYFYYILADVKALFDKFAPQEKLDKYDEMYFAFNGQALKWNLPVGVQFDALVGLARKQEELPWSLVFHYKDNPNRAYHHQNMGSYQQFKFFFINALKESQSLRMSDASEIMTHIQHKDQTKMIEDGLFKNNYESFWEINHNLRLKHIGDLQRYALRIYSNKHHTFVQLDCKTENKPVQTDGLEYQQGSKEFEVWEKAQIELTVGEVLLDAFPDLFINGLDEETMEQTVELQTDKRQFEVLIHGVPLDLATKVYWLQINLSYPDNFAYICFHFF